MEYLTLLAVMLVAAACTTAVMPAFAAEYVVDMPEGTALTGCEVTDACFIPSSVTIDVGDEVTWTNSDIAAHTVASGSAQEGQSGLFNSGFVLAGGSFSVAFNDYEPGTYPYFCIVHPWRLGSVTVSGETADESDTGTTTPTGSGTGVIETDVQRVARLQSATSDHEERILALQEQINYIISELSRLVSLILAVQVELAALMLTDPEPIIVPEHNEVNTLELYIMTDKAAYGLNDTIRVTASQPMPVNVGPLPLDGSEPELTRMQYQLV